MCYELLSWNFTIKCYRAVVMWVSISPQTSPIREQKAIVKESVFLLPSVFLNPFPDSSFSPVCFTLSSHSAFASRRLGVLNKWEYVCLWPESYPCTVSPLCMAWVYNTSALLHTHTHTQSLTRPPRPLPANHPFTVSPFLCQVHSIPPSITLKCTHQNWSLFFIVC